MCIYVNQLMDFIQDHDDFSRRTIKSRPRLGDFNDTLIYNREKDIYYTLIYKRKRDGLMLVDGFNVKKYTRAALPMKYKELTY